ncbi:MAG: hypothetical protein NTX65_03625 [Ignavibacteriales bacterium]|nr:hypothetical protein [Ignavibacteriales bacterium]
MRYVYVLIVVLFLSTTFSTSSRVDAQIRFGISFNLNSQPAWGPTGYDEVEYYYIPGIEAYYNVSLHRFYFNERGRWVGRTSLPYRYRNFNLYNSYKVVINEREPWRNHNNYREKYSSFRDRHDQQPIRDSRESKYFANKYHPEHNNWIKQQRQDKNKRDGWSKRNDNNDRKENNNQNNDRNKKNGRNKK